MTCPVMYPEASSARNTRVRAISSGHAQPSHGCLLGQGRPVLLGKSGHHVSVNDTGSHHIDGDAAGPFLLGQRLAETDQPCFGGTVGDFTAAAGLPPHAAHQQDSTVFAVDHAGQSGPAGVKGSVQIHRHDAAPVLIGGIGEEFLLGNAGVTDKNLQSAQFLFGTPHRHGDLGRVGGIGTQSQKLTVGSDLPGLGQYLFGGAAVMVPGEGHIIARAGKGQHRGGADAAAAAGDQYTLFHLISSSVSRAAWQKNPAARPALPPAEVPVQSQDDD